MAGLVDVVAPEKSPEGPPDEGMAKRDADRRKLVKGDLLKLQSKGFPDPEDFLVGKDTISDMAEIISRVAGCLNFKTSFETVDTEDSQLYSALFKLYEQVIAVHEVLAEF